METFTITELSYAIIAIAGAISGMLMVVWKSRCTTIECGYGCMKCDRNVLMEEGSTPTSASPSASALEMDRGVP